MRAAESQAHTEQEALSSCTELNRRWGSSQLLILRVMIVEQEAALAPRQARRADQARLAAAQRAAVDTEADEAIARPAHPAPVRAAAAAPVAAAAEAEVVAIVAIDARALAAAHIRAFDAPVNSLHQSLLGSGPLTRSHRSSR